MSTATNSFSAGFASVALAAGDQTSTFTATKTAAWSGTAVAYGDAVAAAQDPGTPHTSAATDAFAYGGNTSSSHSSTWSVDFSSGSMHTSVDISVSTAASYGQGDALSGYGLTAPSLHGLF
ncbi:MAG TPA: hypothetical protein VKY24_25055 [Reyranella sp.]|nr:hypothetical protein [Reyranella sp.]